MVKAQSLSCAVTNAPMWAASGRVALMLLNEISNVVSYRLQTNHGASDPGFQWRAADNGHPLLYGSHYRVSARANSVLSRRTKEKYTSYGRLSNVGPPCGSRRALLCRGSTGGAIACETGAHVRYYLLTVALSSLIIIPLLDLGYGFLLATQMRIQIEYLSVTSLAVSVREVRTAR